MKLSQKGRSGRIPEQLQMTGQGRRYKFAPVEEPIHLKLRGELRGEISKACLHRCGPSYQVIAE